jgi:hypothetical protein
MVGLDPESDPAAQGPFRIGRLRTGRVIRGPRARARGPRRHTWLRLLAVLAGLVIIFQVGIDPWAAHIGGRFTPFGTWKGYGRVTASNGGRYLLYLDLFGGGFATVDGGTRTSCSTRGCDNVTGTAKLCGTGGVTETFSFSGSIGGLWTWSTDGAKASLLLGGGKPGRLLEGDRIAWRGSWQGSSLRLSNPDNSFTENVTAAGRVRTTSTTTADAGTASVTVSPGDQAAFTRACAALRSRG